MFNLLAFTLEGVNDAVTAIMAILVASMLRVIWSLQQRISRLEGIDEHRERVLSRDKNDDDAEEGGES